MVESEEREFKGQLIDFGKFPKLCLIYFPINKEDNTQWIRDAQFNNNKALKIHMK